MALTFIERQRISDLSIPVRCLKAVWLWRHPWQVLFDIDRDSKPTLYFYNPIDKFFYYRRPENAVRDDWQRARGLDDALSDALKYFRHDLCLDCWEVTGDE